METRDKGFVMTSLRLNRDLHLKAKVAAVSQGSTLSALIHRGLEAVLQGEA